MRTRRLVWGLVAMVLLATACDDDSNVFVGGEAPAAPRNLDGRYFNRAVILTWELDPAWDDDSFRVYSKRTTDSDFFLIAEVTNCVGGLCSYSDVNIREGTSYEYFVSAVDPVSGLETDSAVTLRIDVPSFTPPPVPGAVVAVALDGAIFLTWNQASRAAQDFSHYRVYLEDDGALLLGETDSEGFLDLLAENGVTSSYWVTAVDDQGHESGGSAVASGTPRPDFHDEFIYSYFDRPELSGFRFQDSEEVNPIVDGDSPSRHFRLEEDVDGWWLVPGPGSQVYPQGFATTALKCGPAADAGCSSLDVAPTTGYGSQDVALFPQTTYVLRFTGAGGALHYAAIRVTMQGFDQNGAVMIFDWAHQLQGGNPNLAPVTSPVRPRP